MGKTKIIILLLFLFISLVFALEWEGVIEAVDKAYKSVGLKTPSYILTIIEKESEFGKKLGDNLGSKKNINRCINMCKKSLIYTKCYSIEARTQWFNQQYSALEKITSNLGLDINKVPFSPDFGIGYTQFQPITWLQYKELQNKNPWNIQDSLYAAAIKLKYDGINENEERAIGKYNGDEDYYEDYPKKRKEWDQVLDDTIFVYECPSSDFSCSLSIIKTNYPECIENDWPIKQKKECIKTKVAFQKERKLATLEIKKKILETSIKNISLEYVNTTPITPIFLISRSFNEFKENKTSTPNNQSQLSFKKNEQNQILNQDTSFSNKKSDYFSYEVYRKPLKQNKNKENKNNLLNKNSNDNLNNQIISSTLNKISEILNNKTTSTISEKKHSQPLQTPKENNNNQFNVVGYGGGGGSLVLNQKKDPCDDYKNKNYPKILINEIQFETASDTKDEFIELYNPNIEEIDLTCWKLEKYSSKRSESNKNQNESDTNSSELTEKQATTLVPSSKFKGKIKPNSYFLITSSSTKEKYQGDLSYAESYSISKNNTIILRKPNGKISDLVGYGDDPEKIFQSENSPFISQNFENKSIQRKNFQDSDNNSKDFWLRNPSPKNSSITESLRPDFIDLSKINFQNFSISISTSSENNFFEINFSLTTTKTFSKNYFFEIKVVTSSDLSDLSIFNYPTPSFPLDSVEGNYTVKIPFKNCVNSSIKFFLFVKDSKDKENQIVTSTEVLLPKDLCSENLEAKCQIVDHSQDNFEEVKKEGKILFSKVKIIKGVNDNEGEFIELYNPNEFPVDISGWYIKKINREGNYSEVKILAPTKIKSIISPFSYFLITNKETCLKLSLPADYFYPNSSPYGLTFDNGLALFNFKDELVDQLCWGNVNNLNCLDNPPEGKVIERKKVSYPEAFSKEELKNLGHGYIAFDDNYNYLIKETFIFSEEEPFNSQIRKEVFKTITKPELKIKGSTTTYSIYDLESLEETKEIFYHFFDFNLTWFSPAYYETSSLFYSLNDIKFKPLILNSLEINLNPLDIFSNLDYDVEVFLYGSSSEEMKEIDSAYLVYHFPGYNLNPEIPLRDLKFLKDENGEVKKVSFINNDDDYEIINMVVIEKRTEGKEFNDLKIKVKTREEEKIIRGRYKEIVESICNNEYNLSYYQFYPDGFPDYLFKGGKEYELEIIEPQETYFFQKCENKEYFFKIYGGTMIFPQ